MNSAARSVSMFADVQLFCPDHYSILESLAPKFTLLADFNIIHTTMPSILVGAFTGIVATYIFLKALLQWTQDPKEPLPVDTTLPFIGPLISMGRGGSNYWTGPQR